MAEKITIQTNRELYKSTLGTSVYSDLNITGDSYTDENGSHSFTDINQPEAIFKVSRKKKIIWTSINGLNSDIPEYMGAENYRIEVEMEINGDNLLYPTQIVQNIITMLGSNQVLTVNSWYLNMFGITNIVIDDEEEPQVRGNLNNQKISFTAMAVIPVILLFQKPQPNSAGSSNNGSNLFV